MSCSVEGALSNSRATEAPNTYCTHKRTVHKHQSNRPTWTHSPNLSCAACQTWNLTRTVETAAEHDYPCIPVATHVSWIRFDHPG